MAAGNDYSSKGLKTRNLAWLVATLVLDVLALLVLAFHAEVADLTADRLAGIRTALTVLLPVPALILSSLISADLKAVLVFWRLKDPLPGSRAFSIHAPADPRVDLALLAKATGEFPETAREQNAKWYGLYKLVDSDSSVVDSHKSYLLFRDIAVMSLLLVPVLPLALNAVGIGAGHILICTAWFLGQYLLTAFAARTAGTRLIRNVLAVHSARASATTKGHAFNHLDG